MYKGVPQHHTGGNWSKDDPLSEKLGTLSLVAFSLLTEKLRQTIETNMDSAQANINVGQAAHNQIKTLTSIPKYWAFKDQFDLIITLCGLNAELLIASNVCTS